MSTVKSACLITSRGVTTKAKSALLKRVFGIEDSALTAFGTDSGLIVALGPKNPADVASTVVACQGRIVFYPDSIDLSRGEGLFDTLGPAMEKLMAAGMKGTLVVVSDDPETCQKQLQSAATLVLQHLVQPKGSTTSNTTGSIYRTIHFTLCRSRSCIGRHLWSHHTRRCRSQCQIGRAHV